MPRKPKAPPEQVRWPKESCGACRYSHLVEKELNCFGAPPQTLMDDENNLYYIESVVVDEHRHPCSFYKQRENS